MVNFIKLENNLNGKYESIIKDLNNLKEQINTKSLKYQINDELTKKDQMYLSELNKLKNNEKRCTVRK